MPEDEKSAETGLEAKAGRAPIPYTRFSLNLANESADSVKAAAEARGISFTDALRRAIAITAAIDKGLADGNELQVVSPAGSVARLIFV